MLSQSFILKQTGLKPFPPRHFNARPPSSSRRGPLHCSPRVALVRIVAEGALCKARPAGSPHRCLRRHAPSHWRYMINNGPQSKTRVFTLLQIRIIPSLHHSTCRACLPVALVHSPDWKSLTLWSGVFSDTTCSPFTTRASRAYCWCSANSC